MSNNNEPLVSIIVPVYKVEKYLFRCVESLKKQTLREIEIILVDDGSPDLCPKICDELKETDSRIKVIHKENNGLSSARNAGLNIATGKYIGFVDSDDDVEINMYETMARIAEKFNVDFVMSDYLRVEDANNKYIKTLSIDGGYYDRDKIKDVVFPSLIMGENLDYGPLISVCNCIYKRNFLEKYHLRFDEDVRWSEDNIFSSFMGYHCNSFYYLKGEALYHYYNNPGTITTSYRKGSWEVYCTMNNHLHFFFDNVEDYDFSRQLKLHIIYYACNCIEQELSLPKKQAVLLIRSILNSGKLKDAFINFKLPDVETKLKIQLLLMKYRNANLLYILKG